MAQSPPPPLEVRPCADPNDAGTEWRAEKLKDLIWRAKCLGVHDSPEVQSLETQMRESTTILNHMAVKQNSPEYNRPWWKDGEYDEVRAERCNDDGMALYQQKKYEQAFDMYTDAARLEPRRAGYHANRAAAGLKLKRYKVAAEDAEVALTIDPQHLRASLRAGEARMRLREPRVSLLHFRNALRIDPSNSVALKGEAKASVAASKEAVDLEHQRNDTRAGLRAPFPSQILWPDLQTAAECALSCEQILIANPKSQIAGVAAAESFVLCGAPKRALKVLEQFYCDEEYESTLESNLEYKLDADLAYVRSSALWRAGDVEGAASSLSFFAEANAEDNVSRKQQSLPTIPLAPKITTLGARLTKLLELMKQGVDAFVEGQPGIAARAFDKALSLPETRAFFFQTSSSGKMKKRQAYPNQARGDLLRRRAECILDAVEQGVVVDLPDGLCEVLVEETNDGDSDDSDRADENNHKPFSLARRDLRECLLIQPNDVEALRLRIRLRRSVGDILGAFDDARVALDINPGDLELNRVARDLAKEAMGESANGTGKSGSNVSDSSSINLSTPAAYRALGVSRSADARQIRRGYRHAAKTWHPDKWQNASTIEKEKAQERFQKVSKAYELLGDAKRKREYDADPKRFEL